MTRSPPRVPTDVATNVLVLDVLAPSLSLTVAVTKYVPAALGVKENVFRFTPAATEKPSLVTLQVVKRPLRSVSEGSEADREKVYDCKGSPLSSLFGPDRAAVGGRLRTSIRAMSVLTAPAESVTRRVTVACEGPSSVVARKVGLTPTSSPRVADT